MSDFPCSCDVETFGGCICSQVVKIQFGAPITFLDRFNAALLIFSTEKVVNSFFEVDYSHVFCDFLDETTKKQILECMHIKHLSDSGLSYSLVSFYGQFFAHIVSKKHFCVGCLTSKEILKIYRELVFSKSGGLAQPLIIFREQL